MNEGEVFDIHPAGMVALDIARIEAGLILIEVDYISSKKALIESQRYSPAEIGLGKLVDLNKEAFVGRDALAAQTKNHPERSLVGLEIDWNEVEALYDKMGMAPQVPGMASRVAVPIYRNGKHVGKATSTTWSPTLKKMIALGSVEPRALGRRQHSEHRNDGRVGAPHRIRENCAATLFQSPQKNYRAGSLTVRSPKHRHFRNCHPGIRRRIREISSTHAWRTKPTRKRSSSSHAKSIRTRKFRGAF